MYNGDEYVYIFSPKNEFIHLLDYQWKRQLKDDQSKVINTNANKDVFQFSPNEHLYN